MISLIISLFFINELVMDYILSIIIRYIYFPTFSSILLTVMISIGIFLSNFLLDKKNDKERIINYIFASYILIYYIIFMSFNIDINSVNALYSNNSIICLRAISRTFIIWIIINSIIRFYKYISRKERG